MNCPSRTDEPPEFDGWNQNPPPLAADLTTRQDLNGIANLRTQRSSDSRIVEDHLDDTGDLVAEEVPPENGEESPASNVDKSLRIHETLRASAVSSSIAVKSGSPPWHAFPNHLKHAGRAVAKFGKFIGPGFMVSVAYIDPGNYSTDVAAGASTRFKLLFIVLMSNVFAIVLQSLAVRLGTVTGLNLAEHCRAHLPRWLNIVLYVLGEGAIIATDIAEVSIKLQSHISLVA